ncbi:MAG: phosphoribosylformylglycinamidine cyclo-ligase [Proteobacteria bacterium]|nr:phosphoribosylformylglycinamidine cyclo-ligase [Pseudomonadota bacterium]
MRNYKENHADSAYAAAGVNYDSLDAFKRLCQHAASTTKESLSPGFAEPPHIRGESAYLVEHGDSFLAHVEEGLGTKNLVADAVKDFVKRPYYAIGIDTVGAIVNDLVTVGALPVAIAMHAGVGSGAWFDDAARAQDLVDGFAEGCRRSGAVWGGGETPALKDVINPGAVVLAGSAMGIVTPKTRRISGKIKAGDKIVMLASSGIHANGITFCRKIAAEHTDGYRARLSDGTTFGEALMRPTVLYARFIRDLLERGIVPFYAVNVTGHGWRKLMRLDAPVRYRINVTPPVSPLFRFLMDRGGLSEREAYATFNMGGGFAVYVDKGDVADVLRIAESGGYEAWEAGVIEDGDRSIKIAGKDIFYDGSALNIRPEGQ